MSFVLFLNKTENVLACFTIYSIGNHLPKIFLRAKLEFDKSGSEAIATEVWMLKPTANKGSISDLSTSKGKKKAELKNDWCRGSGKQNHQNSKSISNFPLQERPRTVHFNGGKGNMWYLNSVGQTKKKSWQTLEAKLFTESGANCFVWQPFTRMFLQHGRNVAATVSRRALTAWVCKISLQIHNYFCHKGLESALHKIRNFFPCCVQGLFTARHSNSVCTSVCSIYKSTCSFPSDK